MDRTLSAGTKKKPSVHRLRVLPFDTVLDVPEGTTILDALRGAGLPIGSSCGGKGTCGDCLVKISEGEVASRASASLPEVIRKQGYALACLTPVRGDVSLVLPKFEQLEIKTVSSSRSSEEAGSDVSGIFGIDPAVTRVPVRLPASSLENNSSDLKRLRQELCREHGISLTGCEYSALKKLAGAVRAKDGRVSAVLFRSGDSFTLLDIRAAEENEKTFGIACDIGTTTVVLNVFDLSSGTMVGSASSLNQQISRGEDVISRIEYARKPGRLRELHDLIAATVNRLIERAAEAAGISPSDIYLAAFAGNTTMTHLFLNLDPRYIREEPYIPTINDVPVLSNRSLRLNMNAEARVYFAPAVGSYVGGDITAGLLGTPVLHPSEKTFLFIDAGTNGEIVVGGRDWLMTCACSAGPAFEGAGTRCGMPATVGAIDRIALDEGGRAEYSVIGGMKPKGLCGSGMVDLLAELFGRGFIDRAGKFTDRARATRWTGTGSDEGFLIEKARRTHWGRDILITEKDISNLIRTKAAVFSACSLLLKNVGLSFDRLDSVYIAGGFGQHLDVENAVRIGLLPDLPRSRFLYLGNTSLFGAGLILLAEKNRASVEEIAGKMTYVELNAEPNYMNEYTGAMFLPHTRMEYFPSLRSEGRELPGKGLISKDRPMRKEEKNG